MSTLIEECKVALTQETLQALKQKIVYFIPQKLLKMCRQKPPIASLCEVADTSAGQLDKALTALKIIHHEQTGAAYTRAIKQHLVDIREPENEEDKQTSSRRGVPTPR